MINIANLYYLADERQQAVLFDYYNEHCFPLVKPSRKYRIQKGDNWCAMFTSVVAHKFGLGANVFPYEVSVMEQIKIAKEGGYFTTDRGLVKEGDLICFDWNSDGWADHVGIITKINKDIISTIEGNFGGTVKNRTVSSNSKSIKGFILLNGN